MATPAFRKLVADLRAELVSRAMGRLVGNMANAADAIAGLLGAEDDGVRLRAAKALLTLGLRLRDSVDVNDRLRDLEEQLAGSMEGKP